MFRFSSEQEALFSIPPLRRKHRKNSLGKNGGDEEKLGEHEDVNEIVWTQDKTL